MKLGSLVIRMAVAVGIAVGATGCVSQEVNDLINGGVKLANGQLTLTASELKAVSDTAIALLNSQTGESLSTLTPEQAQAVVDFLAANNLNTFDDVNAFVQQVEQDPNNVQGLDGLATAFAGEIEGFDPNNFNPEQLWQLMGQIFGGYTGAFNGQYPGGSGGGSGGSQGITGNAGSPSGS